MKLHDYISVTRVSIGRSTSIKALVTHANLRHFIATNVLFKPMVQLKGNLMHAGR